MVLYFGFCDAGMFSLTVELCDDDDDDDGVERLRLLVNAPRPETSAVKVFHRAMLPFVE